MYQQNIQSANIIALDLWFADTYILQMKLSQSMSSIPGQYIELKNQQGGWSAYSIYKQEDDKTIYLLIKANDAKKNISYLKYLFINHSIVVLRGPSGTCTPSIKFSHTVCIAHGMAISPIHSILTAPNIINTKKLSVIWLINNYNIQPLVQKIDSLTKFNVACYIFHSSKKCYISDLKLQTSQIITDHKDTECLLFGSFLFVKNCMAVLNELSVKTVKSDYEFTEEMIA